MGLRSFIVASERASYVDCFRCLAWPAFSSDLWVIGFVATALGAVYLVSNLMLRWVLGTTACGALLAYASDIAVTSLLNRRLHLDDAIKYGADPDTATAGAALIAASPVGAAVVTASFSAIAILAWGFWKSREVTSQRRTQGAVLAATGAVCLAVAFLNSGTQYFDGEYYENVFLINVNETTRNLHSEEFLSRISASYQRQAEQIEGQGKRLSILVVVIESWSLHHTDLFLKINNWTPRLDEQARRGSWFTNFYSNGYSTETGLIALLGGTLPIPTHKGWGVLAYNTAEQDALRTLASAGYSTAFFTSGSLNFGDKGNWLRSIGVEHIEGSSHKAYDGYPRGPFNAASDRVLVERFISWYDTERGDNPFFATVLNVGTHPPFTDVDDTDSALSGERYAFARIDEHVDYLISQLEERDFLETGLIFVVGDHRAMTPVGPLEMVSIGDSGLNRVPAFVLGETELPQGKIDGIFQQADLIPSILQLVLKESCLANWQGTMFSSPPSPAKHVTYMHPGKRDQVQVIQNGTSYSLKLDGDATRWLGAAPQNAEELLKQIILQRVSTDPDRSGEGITGC